MSAWDTWDGTSEITATNGYYIAVAETEPDYSCERVGKTRVKSLVATSTAGSYNSGTGVWTNGGVTFTLTQKVNNETEVTGELPYENADAILGLPAGNRFSVKIKNTSIHSRDSLPSGIIAKVTNTGASGGFNTYDKSAFESDGSLITVANIVNKDNPLLIKITWVEGNEVTYKFDLSRVTMGEPEPEPEGTTYTDGTTSLTINDDETFVLDENGTETTGIQYASIPQTQGITAEYFLIYEESGGTKYALVDISGTQGNYTITINRTPSAYNDALFVDDTETFVPLTYDTSQGANEVTATAVQNATVNTLLFDHTAQNINNLTLSNAVYDVQLAGVFVTSVLYEGTKEAFRQNVTLSGSANQYFDVYNSTEGTPYYSVVFYGNSVYYAEINPETGTGTFTRIDSTISDVNKLSGTVAGSYDEGTGNMFLTFTYLDNTTDTFKIVTEEFGGQYVELIEGE